MSQVVFAILCALGSFCAAFFALRLLRPKPAAADPSLSDDTLVFLIKDNEVIDANFPGWRILENGTAVNSDVENLRMFLGQHFQNVDVLTSLGPSDVSAQSDDGQLQAQRQIAGDTIRICITSVARDASPYSDIHSLRAMENELALLRANTAAAPFLLWRQNREGGVTWVNNAYLEQAKTTLNEAVGTWPLPVLFPSLKSINASCSMEARRIAINGNGSKDDAWYDCHVAAVGQDLLCTAIPADEAVRSENRRREFTQTLTKTFAELAIGLAIFDRSRRLVLFNPALLDLTNLPTDFLTSRPSLVGFLDRLRENRVMPEPRDYKSWRAAIAELEAAASDGTYSETWSLPDGQTYHVTGRPHPDGAVALLFEDISAEMSLTRHFRTELEQSQSVFDALDDGIAVFSPNGELSICNQAYRDLWQMPQEDILVGTLTEATRHWHEFAAPTPVWGDFREFAQSNHEREEWTATVTLRDGRPVQCRFTPQKAGATMAIFRIGTVQAATQENLQKAI